MRADVSREDDCAAVLEACLDGFGACDILLNNAGIIVSGSILDGTVEDFDRVLAVNLRGPFLLSRLVARQMVERGIKGSIVHMSSTNSGRGHPPTSCRTRSRRAGSSSSPASWPWRSPLTTFA